MDNKLNCVEDIFNEKMIGNHSDYYLQTIIYSNIVRHSAKVNANNLQVSPALIFIQHSQKGSPVLCFDKEPINDVLDYEDRFRANLDNLLAEIFDPSQPFVPTDDRKRCEFCPFKKLCS